MSSHYVNNTTPYYGLRKPIEGAPLRCSLYSKLAVEVRVDYYIRIPTVKRGEKEASKLKEGRKHTRT